MTPLRIAAGRLDHPQVVELLGLHLARARAATAEGFAFALDLSGLKSPDIAFFGAWEGETLRGVAALKSLDPGHGEVKSMHTAQAARRGGVGSALLRHLIDEARRRGMARLSLETGTSAYFQPAVALYERHGFTPCGPFGDYAASAENRFLTLAL